MKNEIRTTQLKNLIFEIYEEMKNFYKKRQKIIVIYKMKN